MLPTTALSFASEHDSLSVRHFTVTERLSALFDVSVTAVSPLDDIDFETIIGQPASLRIAHAGLDGIAPSREWRGVCYHFEQIQAESTGLSTYLVRIAPELWLLTQRQNHRIFQHLTIPEIVEKILLEWKLEHVLQIDAATYPKQEYRVQYGETDFAFVSRLLEEAGIAYRFALDPDKGTQVVLTDKPHRRDSRAGGPLPYVDHARYELRKEIVTKVRVVREIRPGAVTMRDFEFRGRIDYPLFGKSALTSASTPADGVETPLEQYRYAPGEFVNEGKQGAEHAALADEKEGKALADRSLEAVRATRETVSFETNVLDLGPGEVFSISGHPKTEVSAPHKLLGLELTLSGSIGGEWSVSGKAAPADTPHRPAKTTPRPRISGVQSAIVVGPKGEDIHTDEFGRVRVQFHWDREGKRDEKSSCWVRVSQGWAGTGFGMMVVPRVGQEVTLGFFEGDPDQPVVIGRVYNAVNRVPYKLPDEKTKSGWRTSSSPGDPSQLAYNELVFEDKRGSELVSIRAQKDLHKLVKASETERTGANRTISVGKSRTSTVGAVDTTNVGTRHVVTVGQTPTSLEMTDKRLVATTGEATVTLDGPNLSLEAKGNITIVAHEGDVIIKGGPNVKINC
jgi:type VI secretion system secreted protein VgrG